jgi:hypothetical protein
MIRSVAEVAARRDLGGRAAVAELDNLIDLAGRGPGAQPTPIEQIKANKQIGANGSPTRRMAHDFNNLLGIITLNLELARERAVSGEVRQMIDEALDAAWQGSELTGRLADFARSQSGWTEQIENGGPAVAARAGPGSL